jgi:murein DD-endopeptidase MepM/ murein hydrolase activator NlpD
MRDSRGDHSHGGQDFPAPVGAAIYAVRAGKVTITDRGVRDKDGYGWYVEVSHGGKPKTWTRYAHVSKITVRKGEKVKAGDKIAEVGETGHADGAHLHFEVLVNGTSLDNKVNPKPWLVGCGVYKPSDFP